MCCRVLESGPRRRGGSLGRRLGRWRPPRSSPLRVVGGGTSAARAPAHRLLLERCILCLISASLSMAFQLAAGMFAGTGWRHAARGTAAGGPPWPALSCPPIAVLACTSRCCRSGPRIQQPASAQRLSSGPLQVSHAQPATRCACRGARQQPGRTTRRSRNRRCRHRCACPSSCRRSTRRWRHLCRHRPCSPRPSASGSAARTMPCSTSSRASGQSTWTPPGGSA